MRWLFSILLLSVVISGCAAAGVGPAPSPVISTTDVPATVTNPNLSFTATPSPSATLTLPSTLKPTSTIIPSQTPEPEITLLFTGQYIPGRCVQAGVDAHGGGDYIFAAVRDIIQSADLAVGTVNGSISDYPPKTGCTRTFVLAGGSEHADILAEAGFHAVSVATNHIKNCGLTNCGDRAFLETLKNLKQSGVTPIGAGETSMQALQPQVFDIDGIRFGIVSLGEIEPLAFAGDNTPGIAVLNEENLRSAIAAAREISDVVIAMPHWGPEYSSNPNWNQRGYAQIAVEAGADLVVGNHTHVVQAAQTIDGVPVFYGLGNFVFDQDWSTETMQSVMLIIRFRGTKLLGTELIPVVSAGDGELRLASEAEAAEILGRIETASAKLP